MNSPLGSQPTEGSSIGVTISPSTSTKKRGVCSALQAQPGTWRVWMTKAFILESQTVKGFGVFIPGFIVDNRLEHHISKLLFEFIKILYSFLENNLLNRN